MKNPDGIHLPSETRTDTIINFSYDTEIYNSIAYSMNYVKIFQEKIFSL